ncbi:transposase [Streptomyces mirabilis]|uniref:IS701 family transposase n=1 Tax=Streptomyces mirabilis TaxID=68239 RepID=UPI00365F63EB
MAGAQHAAVQRLQFFLSESTWSQEAVNARRLELLLADPAPAPHPGGVLVIDDSGDRKDGTATAHVGKQYLGSVGKIDRGVVTVTTCWADERVYYPVHACPYTPAHHFPRGKSDLGFRTKLQIAADLAAQAKAAGLVFRAVAADCAYGDQDSFRSDLHSASLPFVMALKPRHGTWAYGLDARTPVDAARLLAWQDAEHPGNWTRIERTFRDGHTATWWAAEARLGWWGPDGNVRLVVATADPATLPAKATWYLATDLPRPGSPRVAESPYPPAARAGSSAGTCGEHRKSAARRYRSCIKGRHGIDDVDAAAGTAPGEDRTPGRFRVRPAARRGLPGTAPRRRQPL